MDFLKKIQKMSEDRAVSGAPEVKPSIPMVPVPPRDTSGVTSSRKSKDAPPGGEVETPKRTRFSKRLAFGGQATGGGGSTLEKPHKAGDSTDTSIEIDDSDTQVEYFKPAWSLSCSSSLLGPSEQKEWVDHALPPNAHKKFSVLDVNEANARLNAAITEVVGLSRHLQSHLEGKDIIISQLKENMGGLSQTMAARDNQLKMLKTERDDVSQENANLRQQLGQAVLEKGKAEELVTQLKRIQNFWVEEGAKVITTTCLQSSEMEDWLAEYGSFLLSIGFSNGVQAVFDKYAHGGDDYWKGKEPAEFPQFVAGRSYDSSYVDDQMCRLQKQGLGFKFLDFLATNSGLSPHEIRSLSFQTGGKDNAEFMDTKADQAAPDPGVPIPRTEQDLPTTPHPEDAAEAENEDDNLQGEIGSVVVGDDSDILAISTLGKA